MKKSGKYVDYGSILKKKVKIEKKEAFLERNWLRITRICMKESSGETKYRQRSKKYVNHGAIIFTIYGLERRYVRLLK